MDRFFSMAPRSTSTQASRRKEERLCCRDASISNFSKHKRWASLVRPKLYASIAHSRIYELGLSLSLVGGLEKDKSDSIEVGSSRVDLQACKLEYSIVSPK